jgi:glycosyltransferase involved in cell wall biosynthesis
MSVTAIMPTYNQAEFLTEAIDSVRPQVRKLVVVDDGSGDETPQILANRSDIHVITHQANRGTADAINTGVNSLEPIDRWWLTWVSSDNVYYKKCFSTLLNETTKDVGVVYGAYDRVDGDRVFKSQFKSYDPDQLISNENCYFGPAFIVRADVWQHHRGRISHDYDNWLRVEEACWKAGLKIVGVDQSVCLYRVHDKRVTVTRRKQYDAPHWKKEAIKRRKSPTPL